MFKDCGLSITTECSLKLVDLLDVKFDLGNSICKQYHQPNNKSLYINKPSNHPPNILKKLAKSIEKSLPETLSNSDVLNRSIEIYKNAL